MFRIGCCIPGGSFMPQGEASISQSYFALINGTAFVNECGYDYTESSIGHLMSLSENELADIVERNLVIDACNCFIPATYSIMNFDDGLEAYVAEALHRMHLVHCDTIVLGSGRARAIPNGMTAAEADKAFMRFLECCEKYAEKEDVTVVLEPLNKSECNFLNTVREGYDIVRRAGLPHIRLLADSYHMAKEEEPFEVLSEVAEFLKHVHVSESIVRICPGLAPDSDFLPRFSKALQDARYTGRVSVECGFEDFEKEAAIGAGFMRKHF